VKVVGINKTTYSLMVYQSAVGCLDELGNEIEIEQFLQSYGLTILTLYVILFIEREVNKL
jgi:hypothetical protein